MSYYSRSLLAIMPERAGDVNRHGNYILEGWNPWKLLRSSILRADICKIKNKKREGGREAASKARLLLVNHVVTWNHSISLELVEDRVAGRVSVCQNGWKKRWRRRKGKLIRGANAHVSLYTHISQCIHLIWWFIYVSLQIIPSEQFIHSVQNFFFC